MNGGFCALYTRSRVYIPEREVSASFYFRGVAGKVYQ
jgi:hypothetical protein